MLLIIYVQSTPNTKYGLRLPVLSTLGARCAALLLHSSHLSSSGRFSYVQSEQYSGSSFDDVLLSE